MLKYITNIKIYNIQNIPNFTNQNTITGKFSRNYKVIIFATFYCKQ